MLTAIEAMKLALPAFLLPFPFVYDPSLLMIGSPIKVAASIAFAIAGIVVVAMAVQNYCFASLDLAKRAVFFLCGLALIGPGLQWNVAGLLVAGALVLYQGRRYRG